MVAGGRQLKFSKHKENSTPGPTLPKNLISVLQTTSYRSFYLTDSGKSTTLKFSVWFDITGTSVTIISTYP